MAVALRILTVLEALVTCGVDNTILINGHTSAWPFSDEIFGNNFESCMDKTTKELENYFKSISELTQDDISSSSHHFSPSSQPKVSTW